MTGSRAPGVPWTLTGTADWFGSFGITWLWDVVGTYDPVTKTVSLTVTNPFPDGCIAVSGQFTQTGTLTGTSFAGSGSNDCGVVYSWTGRGKGGDCPAGVSPRLIDGHQAAGGASSAKVLSADVAINTYPNPTSDYAMVNLNSVIGEQVSVEAYDASGRLVANILNGEATSGGAYWDVTNQPNGIYLIRVSGESFTKTLTVQVQH